MQLTLLQLNILKGRFLPAIITFVKKQKFDVLHFQEVNGGEKSWLRRDTFKKLQKALPYQGILAIAHYVKGDPRSYSAVASFVKPELQLGQTAIIRLKRFGVVVPGKTRVRDYPRCALAQELILGHKRICLINAHLAWGSKSEDRKYKTVQAERLIKYLKNLETPFILSGDFNLDPTTQIVKSFGTLARNLSTAYKLKTTLNPRLHYAKHLFPPGLVVDYIFVSKPIRVKSFRVLEELDLSDHLGLAAEFEI